MAVTLEFKQTGSTTAQLHLQSGDTCTIAIANTVNSSQLAWAEAELTELGNICGVTFALDLTGDAA